jgi:hypothetical protein
VANQTLHLYLSNIRAPITLTAIGEQIWVNPFYSTDATFYQVASNDIQTVKKLSQKGLQRKIKPSIYEVTLERQHILEPHEGRRQRQPF